MRFASSLVLASSVVVLASCGETGPSRFGYALVRPACGLTGGPALQVRLSEQPVSCDTVEDRPGVWIFASGATLEPQRFASPATGISHCEGDVCESLEGHVEITDVGEERVGLEWSLTFDDGSVDEGAIDALRCAQVEGCR